MPEAEAVGAFLGAAFLGDSDLVSDLLAIWEPTALSKKPPPEEPVTNGQMTRQRVAVTAFRASLLKPSSIHKTDLQCVSQTNSHF